MNKHKPAENTTQDHSSTIDESPNHFQALKNPEDPYFDAYTHLLPSPISKNTTTPPVPPQT